MKTHELGEPVTRRSALGLVGGFAALAVGAAPPMHERTKLSVDMTVVDYAYAAPSDERLEEDATAPDVDRVDVLVDNHGEQFVPVFFSWDQRRKGRHNWEIESGPVPLGRGGQAEYRLTSPVKSGRMNAGSPAQLTVFKRGTQQWQSIRFTPESRREEVLE